MRTWRRLKPPHSIPLDDLIINSEREREDKRIRTSLSLFITIGITPVTCHQMPRRLQLLKSLVTLSHNLHFFFYLKTETNNVSFNIKKKPFSFFSCGSFITLSGWQAAATGWCRELYSSSWSMHNACTYHFFSFSFFLVPDWDPSRVDGELVLETMDSSWKIGRAWCNARCKREFHKLHFRVVDDDDDILWA